MSLLLPNRHLKTSNSLAVQAARLYARMDSVTSVATAWAAYKEIMPDMPFSRFVLTLDVLVALRLLRFDGDFLMKEAPDAAQD
ncbi:ABC-three component system middle component 6 [Streptomyces sp. NPDC048489]|uniref:ABC-three component system middle component 6 n=1 Tax=Streptomyces sp. NPDC048489 TaxID=3154504 RepID=UPI00342E5444